MTVESPQLKSTKGGPGRVTTTHRAYKLYPELANDTEVLVVVQPSGSQLFGAGDVLRIKIAHGNCDRPVLYGLCQ